MISAAGTTARLKKRLRQAGACTRNWAIEQLSQAYFVKCGWTIAQSGSSQA